MEDLFYKTKGISFLENPHKLNDSKEKGIIYYKDKTVDYAISSNNGLIISKMYKNFVIDNLNFIKEEYSAKKIPQAINEGILSLAGAEVECAVLDDKRRMITQTALFQAFERPRKGLVRVEGYPSIIGGKNLAKHASDELLEKSKVIEYVSMKGRIVTGYNAEIIPLICEVYLDAEAEGEIVAKQLSNLERAKILIRALAKIGITGLIDEATGYQYEREVNALQRLLDGYVSEDLTKWGGIFPKKYYKEIFRLHNWNYDPTSSARPSYVGTFTNTYVYGMLPPGVLDKLKIETPIKVSKNSKKAYRADKYYERLTETGIDEVDSYIDRIIMFMEMCDDIQEFKNKFPRVFKDRLDVLEKMHNDFKDELQLKINL
ncbi:MULTISPECIES: P63C domain-containing protein [unclassified Clostridium]|uniref:P63C domain-containing protein n=1 Tax=unclassified Clostridium TaxID=2614128 RepID=UPI0025C6D913|nr:MULTISPECIES: P63C domain-containing protein [unclassified Clostridium]